jgi:putative transcriptional regulator
MATSKTISVSIGSKLARIRNEAGLSQTDLEEKAGVSRKHISAIENDAVSPTMMVLDALIRACNSTLPDFFESRVVGRYKDSNHQQLHEALQRILEGGDKASVQAVKTMIETFDTR